MEQHTEVAPASAPLLSIRPQPRWLVWGVVATIIASGLVMGVYVWHSRGFAPGLLFTSIYSKPGLPVASPLVVVPNGISFFFQKAKIVTPPDGSGRIVVDIVRGAHANYYLLLDPVTSSTNLYEETGGIGNHKLTALTHSSTIKFALSYDATSETFAYQAGMAKNAGEAIQKNDWQLTTFSIRSNQERAIGVGSEPHVLSGGAVVARIGDTLALFPLAGSSTPSTLLTLRHTLPFAVSPVTKTLTVYNPVTRSVDMYSLLTSGQVSYRYSKRLSYLPTAMTYLGSQLLVAGNDGKQVYYTLLDGIGTLHFPRSISPVPSAISAYE